MKRMFLSITLLLVTACGGGTSGTASTGDFTEKTFTGQLIDRNGNPLSNAKVEIEVTGDSTTTDDNGAFSLISSVPVGKNDVLVTGSDGSHYIIIAYVAEDEETVLLREIYPEIAQSRYGRWELVAQVTGKGCEQAYFDTAPIAADAKEVQDAIDREAAAFGYTGLGLFQTRSVRDGTVCNFNIQVLKDGVAVPNLSYHADLNDCSKFEAGENSPNQLAPIADGVTDASGKLSVPFTAVSSGVCGYEVKIPKYGGLRLGALVDIITGHSF